MTIRVATPGSGVLAEDSVRVIAPDGGAFTRPEKAIATPSNGIASGVLVNVGNRRDHVIGRLFGYGENVTGGYAAPTDTIVSSASEFYNATISNPGTPKWIIINDTVPENEVWKMPIQGNPPNLNGDTTLDGMTGKPIIQLGELGPPEHTPPTGNETYNYYPDGDGTVAATIDQWRVYLPNDNPPIIIGKGAAYWRLTQSNNIIIGLQVRGDGRWPMTLSGNGPTDAFEMQGGSQYAIMNCTFSRMTDETVSMWGSNIKGVTVAFCDFFESKNIAINGFSGNRGFPAKNEVTHAYNRMRDIKDGRTGLFYHMDAHVVNTWADQYGTQGIQAWQGARVIAEGNILKPDATAANGATIVHGQKVDSGNGYSSAGVLHATNDLVDLSTAHPTAPVQNSFITGSGNIPFTLPYTWPVDLPIFDPNTQRTAMEAYMIANCGHNGDIIPNGFTS